MAKKSGNSLFGLFKLKKKKERRDEGDSERDEAVVNKENVYRIYRSDEDRLNWVGDPQIDAKATDFINAMRLQYRKSSDTNNNDEDDVWKQH
ncbi:unnamed protein product [Cuscuta epithymum]|uniref:Uncharacterized protein n=1 Tax=Cuscuta epithymum TaxID=186058 RepID=A0AAV0BX77_9ASTE|nr:unnamed protein product [Cuscuta epithymum]